MLNMSNNIDACLHDSTYLCWYCWLSCHSLPWDCPSHSSDLWASTVAADRMSRCQSWKSGDEWRQGENMISVCSVLAPNSCLKDMLADRVCTRPGLNLNPAKRLGWKSLVVHCVALCMSTVCVDAWKMSVFVEDSGERESMVICLCVCQYWVVNYSKVLSLKLKVFGRGI